MDTFFTEQLRECASHACQVPIVKTLESVARWFIFRPMFVEQQISNSIFFSLKNTNKVV